MNTVRKSLIICGNELMRFSRDKVALFFNFVFPVILIVVIGSATAGFDRDDYSVGVVMPAKAGALATQLRDALEDHPGIALETYDDKLEMAKAVRRATVFAGVAIPSDYDATLRAGKPASVELMIDQTRGSPAAIRSVVAEVIAAEGGVLQAAIFTSEHAELSIDAALAQAERSQGLVSGVAIGVSSSTVGEDDDGETLGPGIGYQAPSNLVLFVFITSVAGAGFMIQSRELRVTQRMFATPTSVREIILGQGLGRVVLAGGQGLFIFLVGRFLFDVDWGNGIAALALISMFVLVGTTFGLLAGSVLKTIDQAGAIAPMVGIAMGMLGGCMWPLEIVPERMQQFGHLFPHAWAMDAWIELIGRRGTIADITTNLAVLGGFVVVLLPLSIWRLRRTLVT